MALDQVKMVAKPRMWDLQINTFQTHFDWKVSRLLSETEDVQLFSHEDLHFSWGFAMTGGYFKAWRRLLPSPAAGFAANRRSGEEIGDASSAAHFGDLADEKWKIFLGLNKFEVFFGAQFFILGGFVKKNEVYLKIIQLLVGLNGETNDFRRCPIILRTN